ncbi:MAG: hypothetical protein WDN28_03600 [Chthoniobacter sp.]
MGTEAITAAVDFADGERDRLAQFRGEHAALQGAAEIQIRLEGGGRICKDAGQVRHPAHAGAHDLEKRFGLVRRPGRIDLMETVHMPDQ